MNVIINVRGIKYDACVKQKSKSHLKYTLQKITQTCDWKFWFGARNVGDELIRGREHLQLIVVPRTSTWHQVHFLLVDTWHPIQ